jgi:hypothetical protein
LKELKAPDKITQQMTRDGLTEINKVTGAAANIGARDAPNAQGAPEASPAGNDAIGAAAGRVSAERRAMKKRAANKQNHEIYKRVHRSPESSRLKFTDAERSDPSMSKAITKSSKAADRYDKARARPAKEKIPAIRRVLDEPTGKAKTRLVFRERDKPPNGKLQHAFDRPGREAALAAHGEVEKSNADGNIGVQSAHFPERRIEGAGRKIGEGCKRAQFKPQKVALRAEGKAVKANAEAVYRRTLKQNPELAGANPLKKA